MCINHRTVNLQSPRKVRGVENSHSMIISFYDGLTDRNDSREATDATGWIVADLSALSHKTHPPYGCRPNPSHLQRAVTPDPDTSWSRVGTAQSPFWRDGDRSLPPGSTVEPTGICGQFLREKACNTLVLEGTARINMF